jgi:hypothetical protein
MFVNVATPGSLNVDELHLYYAEQPLGPWTPHPRNPIKSDVRSARPAGPILRRDGRLYRPSQDCSGRYGRAVVINRIDRLDPEGYGEREVGRIEPDPRSGTLGTHTLALQPTLTCVDGVLRVGRRGSRGDDLREMELIVHDREGDPLASSGRARPALQAAGFASALFRRFSASGPEEWETLAGSSNLPGRGR